MTAPEPEDTPPEQHPRPGKLARAVREAIVVLFWCLFVLVLFGVVVAFAAPVLDPPLPAVFALFGLPGFYWGLRFTSLAYALHASKESLVAGKFPRPVVAIVHGVAMAGLGLALWWLSGGLTSVAWAPWLVVALWGSMGAREGSNVWPILLLAFAHC